MSCHCTKVDNRRKVYEVEAEINGEFKTIFIIAYYLPNEGEIKDAFGCSCSTTNFVVKSVIQITNSAISIPGRIT